MTDTPNIGDYGELGAEEALEALEELKRQSGGAYLDLEVGETQFRILPRKKPLQTFVLVSTHFVTFPDDRKVIFACPRKHANRAPCPMCEEADVAYKAAQLADNDKAMQRAKGMYSRTRAFYNVIDRDDEKAGPKTLRMPYGCHKELMILIKRKKVSISNPEEGFDVVIEREGTKKHDTEYRVYLDEDGPTELGSLDWLTQQDPDLERHTAVDPYPTIVARLRGEINTAAPGAQALPASPTAPVAAEVVDEPEPKKRRRRREAASKDESPAVDTDDDIPF